MNETLTTQTNESPEELGNLTVRVEQHHIERGLLHERSKCMVALAIREALPLVENVEVIASLGAVLYSDLVGTPFFYRADIPRHAQREIHRFDNGDCITPFEFSIQVPSCLLPKEPQRVPEPQSTSSTQPAEGVIQEK